MKPPLEYKYSYGDLLENPQTYQYSAFEGSRFLEAWLSNRNKIRKELGAPAGPPITSGKYPFQMSPFCQTDELLENLMAGVIRIDSIDHLELQQKLEILIKRFEVSKRLFDAYDEKFQPLDKKNYHELGRYLRFAELVEHAYSVNLCLPYLNVFLKILDTLIASRDKLDDMQKSRLSWLIERERIHIHRCAIRCGVETCI